MGRSNYFFQATGSRYFGGIYWNTIYPWHGSKQIYFCRVIPLKNWETMKMYLNILKYLYYKHWKYLIPASTFTVLRHCHVYHVIFAILSSSHVWLWELDHKEGWAPKNWCFSTVVLEKTLESPLDCKIKPVNPKGNQSWIFIGRTDAEAETTILWPPDVKNWLLRKDPAAGKDWRQEEKGTTEDEMVGWRHWLNGHAPGADYG